jgi:hypothetical protein
MREPSPDDGREVRLAGRLRRILEGCVWISESLEAGEVYDLNRLVEHIECEATAALTLLGEGDSS